MIFFLLYTFFKVVSFELRLVRIIHFPKCSWPSLWITLPMDLTKVVHCPGALAGAGQRRETPSRMWPKELCLNYCYFLRNNPSSPWVSHLSNAAQGRVIRLAFSDSFTTFSKEKICSVSKRTRSIFCFNEIKIKERRSCTPWLNTRHPQENGLVTNNFLFVFFNEFNLCML